MLRGSRSLSVRTRVDMLGKCLSVQQNGSAQATPTGVIFIALTELTPGLSQPFCDAVVVEKRVGAARELPPLVTLLQQA